MELVGRISGKDLRPFSQGLNDVLTIDRLLLKEQLSQLLQHIFVPVQHLCRPSLSLFDQVHHLLVHLLGQVLGFFADVGLFLHGDVVGLLAHSILCNHSSCDLIDFLQIVGCSRTGRTQEEFLAGQSSHHNGDLIDQFIFGLDIGAFRKVLRIAKCSLRSRNNGQLDQGISALQKPSAYCMSSLMIGYPLPCLGVDQIFLLVSSCYPL